MNIRPESRKKFENQGVYLTKQHLGMDNMEPVEKLEMQSWLAEKERRARRQETVRFRWVLGFTIVAALSGLIAALPVVKGWLMK
jgi:hypothetical protein